MFSILLTVLLHSCVFSGVIGQFPFFTTKTPATTTRRTFFTTTPTSTASVSFIKDAQCPCVKPVGSNTCLQYNVEYQAATFEEAMNNFVDLTKLTPTKSKVLDCTSKPMVCECVEHLMKIGDMKYQFPINNSFSSRHGSYQRPPKFEGPWDDINAMTKYCTEITSYFAPFGPGPRVAPWNTGSGTENDSWSGGWSKRTKRQTTTSPYTNVYNVDCRQKGQPVSDGSSWCGLCDVCWQWGILGPNYFPQYVNQMGCGNSTRCLSGYGTCQQRLRSITVLRNTGTFTPNWSEYTINVPLVCDCQVIQSSAITTMVLN